MDTCQHPATTYCIILFHAPNVFHRILNINNNNIFSFIYFLLPCVTVSVNGVNWKGTKDVALSGYLFSTAVVKMSLGQCVRVRVRVRVGPMTCSFCSTR